ncbi:carboxypeptidase-like regulatory domain-containing protein [Mucilaginibacter sp. BJC16-A38]|uniref:carboxypeptidase-like regulatory domain-containing protein n=1 Tax=Mucilaginibacter phenanthrenivorans TaxID=1234842 RepID=UPI0021574DB7|nr:carboxypeptidase-like regulatory domain-containing protein [Mucilaginibacter phenanthrenivorans]MCR8559684.1 carboxypeptidase-like regulatory domain-containing protein [Mucilaginibacter phenanthrenivorans]
MKYLLFFMLLVNTICSYGQQIRGTVIYNDTKLPVNGAMASIGKNQSFTNSFGEFSVAASGSNDSLKVSFFGYKTFSTKVSVVMAHIHVELEAAKIQLRQVTIHANRKLDFKKDSAANRKFYAKQFNYKGPRVIDAFIPRPVTNTSQLISIDLITLVRALTKKSTREYKFNKVLIRDEKTDYINQKFSHGLVAKVTGLKGDTLSTFIVNYRPTYQYASKASDYKMELYIKDCYQKFLKNGFKSNELFNANKRDTAEFRLN